ncbi:flagellar protein FlaG [Janthinobacterium aquaticum]|uniref:flagellar protein FlaG n=1 Tax=Janthinobacterium sp. FT58W TaxID=2654254 RepID=UPI0012648F4B|nr:flagellar protein FlaG [Janthinobacterium sp. FT58W]KAB8036190.1 flagellar biosynthesis protein FlaG [Janthinobacterium sp. FT58W]
MDILPSNNVAATPLRAVTPAPGNVISNGKTSPAAGVASTAETKKPADDAELKEVKQAVSDINKAMQFMSRQLEFSVDTDSDRTIVKVIDQQTREVIRQMPTKEALEIGKALEKAQGLLIKQTA